MHFPGLRHSGSVSQVLHKGTDSVRPAFCALPRSEQLRRPGAWRAQSPQRSIVQNPKKSWLATKPACTSVYDASLGPRLPLPALAALACLSPVGEGPVRSRLAQLSPLFCERGWWCFRLGLFLESWDSYPTVWVAISS